MLNLETWVKRFIMWVSKMEPLSYKFCTDLLLSKQKQQLAIENPREEIT